MFINKYWQKPQQAGLLVWACLLVALVLMACGQSSVNGPSRTDFYVFVRPSNFPEPTYTFDNNPVTQAGFELGRRLFFDPLLSRDGSVSCNNCHIQATGFSDSQQHPFSIGVDNRMGFRNAPSLVNLAFMPEFFWDGGVTHLDFVPINAIESDFEMDESLENVVVKLNDHETYPALFKTAFDVDEITSPYLLYALSQFTAMMVSANSKYDKYVRTEGERLTEVELEGLHLFQTRCGSCHSGALFSDFSYRNNGLGDVDDEGRGRITEVDGDVGKFRVPSLRNVARTSPYMLNAKFKTLNEVLDHYANGVVDSPTLDPLLKQNGRLGIALSEVEKEQIIIFLETLTDFEFIANPNFRLVR